MSTTSAPSRSGRPRPSPELDEDVRQSIARIRASPFIPRKGAIRGALHEVP